MHLYSPVTHIPYLEAIYKTQSSTSKRMKCTPIKKNVKFNKKTVKMLRLC